MPDYLYMMESRLTPDQQRAAVRVQEVARAHSMNVYLVGGALRDMTSGAMIRDLDFVVQGNALKLQKDLEKSGAVVEGSSDTYRTMFLNFPGNVRLELSSARQESFPKPGKPEVEFATISEDLRRRDFTVNAMALSLNPGSRGLLLDPFNGIADIESKHLRILHNYAFLEEPSRLIRATRFQTRFHWTMDERTQGRYDAAKENGYIDNISDWHLGYEVEQLAYEDDPLHVLKQYEKEGWLKVLGPHWSLSRVDGPGLQQVMKLRQYMQDLGYVVDTSAVSMHFLTHKMPEKEVAAMQKQVPRRAFVQTWKNVEEEAKELSKRLSGKEAATPSLAWKLLSSVKPETILFLEITTRQPAVKQKIHNFFGKWRQFKQRLPFPEMPELRITPELPEYPKIMEEAFYLLLEGKLRTQPEIYKFLKPYSPPEPVAPPPPARRGRAKKAESKPLAPAGAATKSPAPPEGKMKKGKGQSGGLVEVAQQVGAALGKLTKTAQELVGAGKPAGPTITMAPKKAAGGKAKAGKSDAAKSKGAAKKKASGKSGGKSAGKGSGGKKSAAKKSARKKK